MFEKALNEIYQKHEKEMPVLRIANVSLKKGIDFFHTVINGLSEKIRNQNKNHKPARSEASQCPEDSNKFSYRTFYIMNKANSSDEETPPQMQFNPNN